MKRIFFVPAVLVLFIACNKYEDGSEFTLQSKTNRISNRWVISATLLNGTDNTIQYSLYYQRYQMNIGRDGQYSIWYQPNGIEYRSESGEWKFEDNKTKIVLTSSSGKMKEYRITCLKEKDLRLKYNDGGSEWEMRFVPKPDQ